MTRRKGSGSRQASPSATAGRGFDVARDAERRPEKSPRPPERRSADPDVALIWGFHAVRAALRSPRRKLLRLYATQPAAAKLAPDIAARSLDVATLEPRDLDLRAPRDALHQGVLLEARPLGPIDLDDVPDDGLILVLDQITDPHNVGAMLRTAAAFGVDALVTTERHSPAMTGVLAKSASGGLEFTPICTVVNLARALERLGERGYARVGFDSEAPVSFADTSAARPLALVFGAEGKGLRRLTRERCDTIARLDLPGAIKSLNVSNACAMALTIASIKGATG